MTDAAPTLPISVIVPAYESAETIGRALRGVFLQRPHAPAEVIVVDDASSDDTARIATGLGATVLRRELNGGAAAARNDGIAAAAHPWVALLDADDEWLPHHLAELWPRRDGHVLLACAALSAGEQVVDDRVHGVLSHHPVTISDPATLVFPDNIIPASGALVRRDSVLAVGGYELNRRFAEDFDLWLRLLGIGTGLLVPRVGCLWRQHAAQKSRRAGAGDVQRAIAEAYAAEPWWSDRLVESRLSVRAWDDLRAALSAGDRRTVLRRAAWVVSRPRRALAVTSIWRWRLRRRRAARAIARDGGPRIQVLPGAPMPPAGERSSDALVDMRSISDRRRTWAWLRSGRPGAAVPASAGQRLLCRAFGVPSLPSPERDATRS